MARHIGTRIVVRTDIDWDALDAESFAAQAADGRPIKFIRGIAKGRGLEVWRDAFAMDFFAFRKELREIAESNLRAVEGAELSFGLEDFGWFHEGDEYVFPIDDDDLFHPQLARRASARAKGEPLVLWRATQLRSDARGRGELAALPLPSFATNNGGFRSVALRAHFDEDEAREVVLRHEIATQQLARRVLGIATPDSARDSLFQTDLRGRSTFFTRDRLSVSIKHPGSLITLFRALQSEDPAGALRASLPRSRVRIPWALRWAEPWVRRVEALLARLDGA